MSVQLIWSNDLGQQFVVSLDCAEREGHKLSSQVTEHPIEAGANASDHIRAEPDRVELIGVVTNTPLALPPDNVDGVQETDETIDGSPRTVGNTFGTLGLPGAGFLARIPLPLPRQQASTRGFSPTFDRVTAVYEAMRRLKDEGALVTIATELRTYENMAIESIDIERTAEIGDALSLSISAKEVRLGATIAAEVPAIETKRVSKGTKTKKAVTESPPEQESMLSQLFGSP